MRLRSPASLLRALLVGLMLASPSGAGESSDANVAEVRRADLRRHVEFLASDELQGRDTTEAGGAAAAEYVARDFGRAGLTPKGGLPALRPELRHGALIAIPERNGEPDPKPDRGFSGRFLSLGEEPEVEVGNRLQPRERSQRAGLFDCALLRLQIGALCERDGHHRIDPRCGQRWKRG